MLGECAVAVIIISKAIRKYPFTRSLTWLLSMGPFAILTIGTIALAQIENIGLRGRAALFGVLGIAFAGLVLSLSWRTVQETIEALGARSTPS